MTFPKRPDHWALIVSDVERRQQRARTARFWRRLATVTIGALVGITTIIASLIEIVSEIQWRKHG